MMNNFKFIYLYRDAGNYKEWASIVFLNPDKSTVESVTEALHRSLIEERLFVANQVRVPECFLYTEGNATTDDHCFHEFDTIEFTSESPNDRHSRSIDQFIGEVTSEAARGWVAFDPHDPYVRRPSVWMLGIGSFIANLTLEAGTSESQTAQMQASFLALVIPLPIQNSYSAKQREWLLSVRQFLGLVRERQSAD
jgi:EcoRII C terminal